MSIKKISIAKYIKRILYISITLGMIFFLGVIGAIYWISTDSGQSYIQRIVNVNLSDRIGYKIKAAGINFRFPLTIKIDKISLADEKGKWLKANNISFGALITPNILKHFIINHFSADNLSLLRIPGKANIISNDSENNQSIKISVRDINIKETLIPPSITHYSREIRGASILGNIQWNSLESSLYFDNSIKFDNLIPRIESNKLIISGKYLFTEENLNAEFQKILNNKIKINGDISFNLKSRNLEINAKLDKFNFSEWFEQVNGEGNVLFKITGTIENPKIRIDSSFQNFSYYKNDIPEINTIINASMDQKILTGDITIDSKNLVKAYSKYKVIKDEIELNDIKVNSFENYISGELSLNLDKNLVDGELQTTIKSFEEYKDYLTMVPQGEINALASLSSLKGQQAINADINIQKMIAQDVSMHKGDVNINIPNVKELDSSSVTAELSRITYKDVNINELMVKALEKKGILNIDTAINGKYNDKTLKFNSNANFYLDDLIKKKEIKVTLNSIKGSYNKTQFSNIGKIDLFSSVKSKFIIIPKLKLNDGVFAFNGKLNDKIVDVTSIGNNIPLGLLNNNLPEVLQDRFLKSQLSIKGNLMDPKMSLNLAIYGQDTDNKELQKFNNQTEIKINDGKAKFKIKSTKKSITDYDFTGEIPVDFDFNSSSILSIKKDDSFEAAFNYNSKTLDMFRLLMPTGHKITGKSSGNLLFSGKYDSPIINGEIKYSEGEYNYFPLNLRLNNITGDFSIKNNIMTINKLFSKDKDKNKLLVNGNVELSDLKDFIYDFKIKTERFSLLSNPSANTVFSGNVDLKGNKEEGKISGTINSERIDLYLPNEFSSSVPKLNIYKVIKDDQSKKKSDKTNYSMLLDIDFNARNRVFIRGWGLNAELGGKLSIKGVVSKPNISGKFSLIRGRYSEFGQTFKLKKVDLLFEGAVPPYPYITMVGSTEVDDVEIMPVISGPLLNPSLSIEASPEHSQEDSLSLLLFGEESSEITSFQAFQLARSMKRLTTGRDSRFSLRKVRDLFGVDDINIDGSDSSSGASVEVQKYVSDGVRLKGGQGGKSGASVGVEADLTSNISVETGATATSGNSVGVNWKYNY